jgi:predicted acyl esterase
VPTTEVRTFSLPGRATIGDSGKFVRSLRVARLTETFGAPTVRVQASSTTGWSHLVAVLVARAPNGSETVVSEGGTPTKLGAKPRPVTIRLISQVTTIPKGSRLELTLAGTSTAQNPGNLLYLVPVPQRAKITLGSVQLAIPALKKPVSR